MRYPTEPRKRKYIKRYGFLSLPENLVINRVKKIMDTATKTGMDAAKSASKKVIQETAEVTGDLIGSKTADEITLACKPKNKGKGDNKVSQTQEIYIPTEKRQQIIDDLRLF